MRRHLGPSIPTMPLVRPTVPCVLAVPGTLHSPARDAGSHGLEMPPRHHDPLRAVVALNTLSGCIPLARARLCELPTWELTRSTCVIRGDTLKLKTERWELHAPVGCSEQRAPTSWLKSPCREKGSAQRRCDIAISPRPPGAIAKFQVSVVTRSRKSHDHRLPRAAQSQTRRKSRRRTPSLRAICQRVQKEPSRNEVAGTGLTTDSCMNLNKFQPQTESLNCTTSKVDHDDCRSMGKAFPALLNRE